MGWVDVKDIKPEQMSAAVSSISQRFGQPNDLSLSRSDVKWAEWRRPELHVKMVCDPTHCTLRFSSAKEHAEHERYLASEKAKEARKARVALGIVSSEPCFAQALKQILLRRRPPSRGRRLRRLTPLLERGQGLAGAVEGGRGERALHEMCPVLWPKSPKSV